jgi:hypothetical protein
MAFLVSSFTRVALLGAVGFSLVEACSASSTNPPGELGGATSTGGMRNGTGGAHVLMPDAGVPEAGSSPVELNPLCGSVKTRTCLPDDARSCASFGETNAQFALLGGGNGGEGGAAGAGGQSFDGAGSGAEGGVGGAGGVSSAGAGNGSGAASGEGGSSTVVAGGAGGALGPPTYACRVGPIGRAIGAACGLTGQGDADAPCFTGSECGAGLACVALDGVSRCRPYCCAGDDACSSGSYCAERPLLDDALAENASVSVPVCVPANNCDLAEPYPCPSGRACQCSAGTACLVVRPDGTTNCMPAEGNGLGEPCPCGYGFVCSQGTQSASCVQICTTASSLLPCPSGRCQVAAELPNGFGTCVDN